MPLLTSEIAQSLRKAHGTDIVIPNIYTAIGAEAFAIEWDDTSTDNRLTSVVIPDSIVSIGDGAFARNQLTRIDIPESVTTISDSSFQKNQLRSLSIPSGITFIDEESFEDNLLASLVIGENVTSIGGEAFQGNRLKSITIPDSVAYIDHDAFDFDLLETVSISKNPSFDLSVFPENVKIIRRSNGTSNDEASAVSPGTSIDEAPTVSPGTATVVNNITNIYNNTNNSTSANISNSGSGNISLCNIGTVNNTTTIDNSFAIQTTNINLSLAITADSKKSEKVEGTDGDDLIADGRGKDKLVGGDGADQFYFSSDEPFKKKTVDKLIDFDLSEGDAIVIADEVVGDLAEDPTLAIADTKKDLKQLSKDGYDLLYFEPKGNLYVDDNGDSKGFGKKSEGGMIADLPNATVLTESDVLIGV